VNFQAHQYESIVRQDGLASPGHLVDTSADSDCIHQLALQTATQFVRRKLAYILAPQNFAYE